MFSMSDKEKPDLKLVSKEPDLTIKQRAFINEIVKGKLGSYKEAYAKAYDVTLTKAGKIPKWVEVEASKLIANPKIALSLHKAIERKEQSVTASSLRTRNYVIEQLYRESKESDSDASRVRALELLGKSVSLFSDVIEERKARDTDEIERDIETKLAQLLAESNE
jgi:organic radical activating enzyme